MELEPDLQWEVASGMKWGLEAERASEAPDARMGIWNSENTAGADFWRKTDSYIPARICGWTWETSQVVDDRLAALLQVLQGCL